jgi:hypothetical protein
MHSRMHGYVRFLRACRSSLAGRKLRECSGYHRLREESASIRATFFRDRSGTVYVRRNFSFTGMLFDFARKEEVGNE